MSYDLQDFFATIANFGLALGGNIPLAVACVIGFGAVVLLILNGRDVLPRRRR